MAKPTKRTIISLSAVVTSIALILTAFTFSGASKNEEEQPETVYRESKVERGDITVGVSESATATLLTHSIKSEYTATIETIKFKPGQSVKQGDVLVTLSLDSIQDELKDAKTAYQECKAIIAGHRANAHQPQPETRKIQTATHNIRSTHKMHGQMVQGKRHEGAGVKTRLCVEIWQQPRQ